MKFSFMSWVCPEATLGQTINLAKKYGYNGIEPRSDCNHRHGVELAASMNERNGIKNLLASSGIEISCIATGIKYSSNDRKVRDSMVEEAKKYVELASDIGCSCIRVFGGLIPKEVRKEDAVKYIAESLSKVGDFAENFLVKVCFETHDDFCKADDALRTVKLANSDSIKILWDVMHPFTKKMTILEAFECIKDHVAHIHIHDGKYVNGNPIFTLMGEGDIPYKEVVSLLKTINFKGYLSGEWINFKPADELLPYEIEKLRSYF